jgi:hypothetical protein
VSQGESVADVQVLAVPDLVEAPVAVQLHDSIREHRWSTLYHKGMQGAAFLVRGVQIDTEREFTNGDIESTVAYGGGWITIECYRATSTKCGSANTWATF